MIEPLNDLFSKALGYRNYRLANKSACYEFSVASRTHRMRKNLDVQMRTDTFTERDPIAVLEFLARFETTCHHNLLNGFSEEAVVWYFQFF